MTIAKPNNFKPNTSVLASKMNQNFDALFDSNSLGLSKYDAQHDITGVHKVITCSALAATGNVSGTDGAFDGFLIIGTTSTLVGASIGGNLAVTGTLSAVGQTLTGFTAITNLATVTASSAQAGNAVGSTVTDVGTDAFVFSISDDGATDIVRNSSFGDVTQFSASNVVYPRMGLPADDAYGVTLNIGTYLIIAGGNIYSEVSGGQSSQPNYGNFFGVTLYRTLPSLSIVDFRDFATNILETSDNTSFQSVVLPFSITKKIEVTADNTRIYLSFLLNTGNVKFMYIDAVKIV